MVKRNKSNLVSAGRNISHETVLAIKEEKLPGIRFIEYKKRFYPNGIFRVLSNRICARGRG